MHKPNTQPDRGTNDPRAIKTPFPVIMPDGKRYEASVSGAARDYPIAYIWNGYHGAHVQAEYEYGTLAKISNEATEENPFKWPKY